MRLRACWAVGLFVVALNCVSVPSPMPTKDQPRTFCAISCPGGWLSRNAKVCRGPRWFRDFSANGEYVSRGADGGKLIDVWTSKDGDFDKRDVVQMPCSSFIKQLVESRDASQRGKHPGEPDPWELPSP